MLIIILCVSFCSDIWYCNMLAYYLGNILTYYLDNQTLSIKMILMRSCPGNMPKYYPSLRDILPSSTGRVICLSDLGNILVYYLDKTTLLYKYILLYTFLLCCHGYIIMFCRVGSCNSGKIVRLSCENPGKLNLYYLS